MKTQAVYAKDGDRVVYFVATGLTSEHGVAINVCDYNHDVLLRGQFSDDAQVAKLALSETDDRSDRSNAEDDVSD